MSRAAPKPLAAASKAKVVLAAQRGQADEFTLTRSAAAAAKPKTRLAAAGGAIANGTKSAAAAPAKLALDPLAGLSSDLPVPTKSKEQLLREREELERRIKERKAVAARQPAPSSQPMLDPLQHAPQSQQQAAAANPVREATSPQPLKAPAQIQPIPINPKATLQPQSPPLPARPIAAAQPARPAPAAALADDEEEEDYYDEDFDEDAAAIEEDDSANRSITPPKPVTAAKPVNRPAALANTSLNLAEAATAAVTSPVVSPGSRLKGLSQRSSSYQPTTPRLPDLVSAIQSQIQKETAPMGPVTSEWKSPRGFVQPPAAASPTNGEQKPSIDQTKRTSGVKLPSKSSQNLNYIKSRDARAQRILKRIHLTTESFDLLHHQPLSSHDRHVKGITLGTIKNGATQFNDDWGAVECQTDTIDTFTLGVQVPEDRFTKFATTTAGMDASTHASTAEANTSQASGEWLVLQTRLPWLLSAAEAIEAVLMENLNETSTHHANSTSLTELSEAAIINKYHLASSVRGELKNLSIGKLSLELPPVFGQRRVVDSQFAPSNTNQIIVGYDRLSEKQLEGQPQILFPRKSLVCVWDLASPATPTQIFYCDGSISCVKIDSLKGNFLFAGLVTGSVVVWDRRDLSSSALASQQNTEVTVNSKSILARPIAFTTDGLLMNFDSTDNHSLALHTARITHIACLPKPKSSDSAYNGGDSNPQALSSKEFDLISFISSSLSDFPLVTLDELGVINLWTVSEVRGQSDLADLASSDYGLSIGARVRLTFNESRNYTNYGIDGHIRNLHFVNDNEFLLLINNAVQRMRRFGATPMPAQYKPKRKRIGQANVEDDDPLLLSVSPHTAVHFLVVYRSGLIALYSLNQSESVMEWFHTASSTNPIVTVEWSAANPAVFVTMTANGEMIWRDCSQSAPVLLLSTGQSMTALAFNTASTSRMARRSDTVLMLLRSQSSDEAGLVELHGLKSSLSETSSYQQDLTALLRLLNQPKPRPSLASAVPTPSKVE